MRVLLLEAVNPVYRRRRLAKILLRYRFHRQMQDHWSKVGDRLEKQGRKIAAHEQKILSPYGGSMVKAPPHVKDAVNAMWRDHHAKRGNAEDQVYHHLHRAHKAYQIATGGSEKEMGGVVIRPKFRVRPQNPLRKNRDPHRLNQVSWVSGRPGKQKWADPG